MKKKWTPKMRKAFARKMAKYRNRNLKGPSFTDYFNKKAVVGKILKNKRKAPSVHNDKMDVYIMNPKKKKTRAVKNLRPVLIDVYMGLQVLMNGMRDGHYGNVTSNIMRLKDYIKKAIKGKL